MRVIKKRSKMAIISPSSGLTDIFPHIYKLGLSNLREHLELEYVEYPTTKMSDRELYENPRLRADDINKAFSDDSIDGIICTIGGYESVRILEFLDIELILNNPKLIMGFSDSTSFLSYFASLGLPTFYGPSIMAGFAQCHNFEMSSIWKNFLYGDWEQYSFPTTDAYVSGYINWQEIDKAGHIKPLETHQKLDVNDDISGQLWGGCIEVLEMLKGTSYFPKLDFFNDKILVFETSEEKPSPMTVGYMLRNYGTSGILSRVKGIAFGRFYGYDQVMLKEIREIIKDIIEIELGLDLNVIYGLNFGHTDPQWIVPLGLNVEIKRNGLTVLTNPWRT